MAPVPFACGHTAPFAAAQVQLNAVIPGGSVSLISVPPAGATPVLVTTTVNVIVPLGVMVVDVVVFWICMRGGWLIVTDAVHGGVVLFGKHTPFTEGVSLAVFVTAAGGAAATIAVIV